MKPIYFPFIFTLGAAVIGSLRVNANDFQTKWERHTLISARDTDPPIVAAKNNNLTIQFWLFTQANRQVGHEVFVGNNESIFNSNFKRRNPTRFIIHGWDGNANSLKNVLIRSAYLDRTDYNIFLMDYSNGNKRANYVAARIRVKEAGKKLGEFIEFLQKNHSLDLDKTYLIGHNLGAHIAGLAGKRFKNQPVPIRTIFGLDPAWPLFSIDDLDSRLAIGDANYVETIHTNGGEYGFHTPIGDASFYPNWGRVQPGCSYDSTGRCSDSLAADYFAESLRDSNDFYAGQCRSYDDIRNLRCLGSDSGKIITMGGDPSSSINRGVFYVPVNESYPYATGSLPDTV